MYLDRNGAVQSVAYRMPAPKKPEGNGASSTGDAAEIPKGRPDVTRRGIGMIGDFRTDALHEALSRAPIANDTLMALLVLALAGRNITIASGTSEDVYGFARMDRHAVRLIGQNGNQRTGTVDAYFDAIELRAALPQYYTVNLTLDGDANPPLETPQDFQNTEAITLTGIDFWDRSAAGGPVVWDLRSSHDNFQMSLASGETHAGEFDHHVSVRINGLLGLRPVDEPLELRLYAYSQQDAAWNIDNLAVLGQLQSLADFPQPPVAHDDTATTLNTNFTFINVLANDFDPNGDTLSIRGFTLPEHGIPEPVRDLIQRTLGA